MDEYALYDYRIRDSDVYCCINSSARIFYKMRNIHSSTIINTTSLPIQFLLSFTSKLNCENK